MGWIRATTRFALFCSMLIGALESLAHDLMDGATVRIQSAHLNPGWHEGKVQITKDGCAMIWKPGLSVPGGPLGLGLIFIDRLERREGAKWIELPVGPMLKQEPKSCQEGAG